MSSLLDAIVAFLNTMGLMPTKKEAEKSHLASAQRNVGIVALILLSIVILVASIAFSLQ